MNQAIVADAAERKTLEAMGLKQMDAAVVCIGSVLSNSILVTLNLTAKKAGLKQSGIRDIQDFFQINTVYKEAK